MNPEKIILETRSHEHGHDLIDHLYLHRHSKVHELPAHLKVIGALLLIGVFVVTPSKLVLAFSIYALVLISIALIAKIPLKTLGRRMVVEVPFVFFAILIPFTSGGEKISLWGIQISIEGSWVAFGILAKSTLGVMTSILLSATTNTRDLLSSLTKLKIPATLVQIASFMLRYTAVVMDESNRMKLARTSRAFTSKGVRDWKVLGQSVSALFIRSYERGERVHLAMISRGFDGESIFDSPSPSTVNQKMLALLPVIIAALSLTLIWTIS